MDNGNPVRIALGITALNTFFAVCLTISVSLRPERQFTWILQVLATAALIKGKTIGIGFNLGLLMRTRFGIGTPRGLQGRLAVVLALLVGLWTHIHDSWRTLRAPMTDYEPTRAASPSRVAADQHLRSSALATGC